MPFLLGFAVLGLLSAASGPAHAEDADMAVHERDKSHAVFARSDFGQNGWDVGAGYMHLWRQADSYRGLGGITWMGLGGDARVFAAHDPGRVSGAGGFATGRVSFMGDAMGMSVEAAVGAADIEGRPRALATVGAGMSFLYLDLAYTYQLPIDGGDRAQAISSHMFTLRITVPVSSYAQTVRTEPVPRSSSR